LYAYSAEGKPAGEIPMPAAGSLDGVSGQEDGKETLFGFSSFAYPDSIFRVSQSNAVRQWWQAGTSLNPKQVEVKQVWYQSKDGTKVPMYIVRKRGIIGPRPTLMTAYGGFDVSVLPSWSPTAAWWVEQGGVFAQPSLRGGGEFGEAWHRAGMLANKQNVFDDFVAAAEYLIHEGITTSRQLAIRGTSNGGLLMGVAITQRPELFGAVVCGAPLLDMIRYQNFRIAKLWVPEYGSSDDPAQFRTLLKYSPYQHVKQGGNYPAILFWSGDGDTRVDPLHARKMTALMQADVAPGPPIILRYDTLTGHSGGRSVDQQLDFDADWLSFAASEVGLSGV
jgi:prolyl oligopeptidase